MPGYETERFVNFSETENSDLLCSICHQIFKDPVVANCCLQTYCRECISEWRKTNNTCPFDRKPLTDSNLVPPPRIVLNLLGKLRIRCQNEGCSEIVNLEDLTQHTANCSGGRKLCKQCFCVLKSPHDCVKELLALNKQESEKNELLLKENQQLIDKEINQSWTISTLTQERDHLRNQYDLDVFLRRFRSGEISREINVIEREMCQDSYDFVNQITFEILNFRNTFDDIAEDIANRMTDQYDWGTWHCFVYFVGGSVCNYVKKYMHFEIENLQFEIFNTEEE